MRLQDLDGSRVCGRVGGHAKILLGFDPDGIAAGGQTRKQDGPDEGEEYVSFHNINQFTALRR